MDDKSLKYLLNEFKEEIKTEISADTATQIKQVKFDISQDTAIQFEQFKSIISQDLEEFKIDITRHMSVLLEDTNKRIDIVIDNVQANTKILKGERNKVENHEERITTLETIQNIKHLN